MRKVWIFIFLCMPVFMMGQDEYSLTPLNDLNSGRDEIACTIFEGQLIFITSGQSDLVNDYSWNLPPAFHLEISKRGDTYSSWRVPVKMFEERDSDVGPASYDPSDSTLYFSTSVNYGNAEGENLKIYSKKWNGERWLDPEVLPFCSASADYTHPDIHPGNGLLVFSSNMSGGYGGMDVWFVYKLENGWGEPVNPGMMVNSSSQEIFPSIHERDIIYSSNQPGGLGGYDLRRAVGEQQWKSSIGLPAPVNSDADDISLLYLNEDKSILTTNRSGGRGGDDMYVIEKLIPPSERNNFKAVLECLGQPVEGTGITITNEFGEVVVRQNTDSIGHIDISPLRFNRSYRVQLGGVDPGLFTDCVMAIYDDKGNKIRELRFNSFGFADLELLPLSYTQLEMLPLDDQSLLTINIEGQLFDTIPGDVGKDEPVTILDEDGIPVAIAYTNNSGKFRFTQVEPRMEYSFRLSKETAASNVLITDKGEKIVLPVLNAEIQYQRVSPQDAIELVNEYNQKIIVSAKDLFVINRIYFLYNSAWLTSEARRQLDQLAIILERNRNIGIELRSHTDSRGNDDYNLKLSTKRSKAAVEFLTSKGIDRSRFTATGLGETMLLNECDDGVVCTEPEHSINRRTEIRLSVLPEPK